MGADSPNAVIGGSDGRRTPVSDEAIAAIVDALIDASDHNVAIEAIVDALVYASDNSVDELEGFAESVLDGLRAAGFELYRPDECAAVGIGRWVEYEGRAVARMMTPPPPEIEPGTYRLVPVEGDS
jgi:hypothetical protein